MQVLPYIHLMCLWQRLHWRRKNWTFSWFFFYGLVFHNYRNFIERLPNALIHPRRVVVNRLIDTDTQFFSKIFNLRSDQRKQGERLDEDESSRHQLKQASLREYFLCWARLTEGKVFSGMRIILKFMKHKHEMAPETCKSCCSALQASFIFPTHLWCCQMNNLFRRRG